MNFDCINGYYRLNAITYFISLSLYCYIATITDGFNSRNCAIMLGYSQYIMPLSISISTSDNKMHAAGPSTFISFSNARWFAHYAHDM
jgi:hypothetical protein